MTSGDLNVLIPWIAGTSFSSTVVGSLHIGITGETVVVLAWVLASQAGMMACPTVLIILIIIVIAGTSPTADASVGLTSITGWILCAGGTSVVTCLTDEIGLHWIGCIWTLGIAKTIHLVVVGMRSSAFPGVEVKARNIVVVGSLRS